MRTWRWRPGSSSMRSSSRRASSRRRSRSSSSARACATRSARASRSRSSSPSVRTRGPRSDGHGGVDPAVGHRVDDGAGEAMLQARDLLAQRSPRRSLVGRGGATAAGSRVGDVEPGHRASPPRGVYPAVRRRGTPGTSTAPPRRGSTARPGSAPPTSRRRSVRRPGRRSGREVAEQRRERRALIGEDEAPGAAAAARLPALPQPLARGRRPEARERRPGRRRRAR